MAKGKPTRAATQLPDIAIVSVMLDRKTGLVDYDDTFSTPMETWAMLSQACARASERIDEVNGTGQEAL
jgi:hypothetical protein